MVTFTAFTAAAVSEKIFFLAKYENHEKIMSYYHEPGHNDDDDDDDSDDDFAGSTLLIQRHPPDSENDHEPLS